MNTNTVSQAISHIKESLSEQYSVGEVNAFIRIIFRNLLNYEPVDILLHKDTVLTDFTIKKIAKVVSELSNNRPIQYIFGQTFFHGHAFNVDPSTLIPRPETEELVDMIVDENSATDLDVLDVGTGSGCIAISLALALKFAKTTAIDISEEALSVARENARRLRADVRFLCRDALSLPVDRDLYDIVVSNPPYICESEKTAMEPNVLDYEPHAALFVPDDDAMRFYRAVSRYASGALRDGGRVYFEINSRFPREVCQALESDGFVDVQTRLDISKRPRFVSGRKKRY